MSSNISITHIQELMDEHATTFLCAVIRNKKAWRSGTADGPMRQNRSGFPALWPDNPGYNEYKGFEERMEHFIRERLVNPILLELFKKYGYRVLIPEVTKHLAFASNEWYERHYECQFIIDADDDRIAYRYTVPSPLYVDMPGLISDDDLKLDRVEIIDWSDTSEKPIETVPASEELKGYFDRVYDVTMGTFLARYFPEQVRKAFVKTVKRAISDANDMLGFQTIPRITDAQLGGFKMRVLSMLRDYEAEPKLYRQARDARRRRQNSIPREDEKELNATFFGEGLYRALCGDNDFAISFVTSEYMRSVFNSGDVFDYTSVVNGYIKSVEQLCYKLMKLTLDMEGSSDLWIKKNRNDPQQNVDAAGNRMVARRHPFAQRDRWSPHVRFIDTNEDCFDTALVPLANLLHDNRGNWRMSDSGRHFLLFKIREFASFDRNGYVHKDNLLDMNEVDRIRSNARLILYMLLGGYKLGGTLVEQYEELGIGSVQYDEMYSALYAIPGGQDRYILEFDGEVSMRTIRLYSLEDEREALEGSASQPKLLFAQVPSFRDDDIERVLVNAGAEDVIELTRINIPLRIKLVVRENSDVRTIWEREAQAREL